MLAYYVEWHLRDKLAPLLFEDEDKEQAEALRTSVVAPAEVSPSARDKARCKRTAGGYPVHSFRTLLDDLSTLTKKPGGASPTRGRTVRDAHPSDTAAA